MFFDEITRTYVYSGIIKDKQFILY